MRAIPAWISVARNAPTTRTNRPPTARLGCLRKPRDRRARLGYLGHLVAENRNGLAVKTRLTLASGRAEREAALAMAGEIPGVRRVTLGADKNYDTQNFVREIRW